MSHSDYFASRADQIAADNQVRELQKTMARPGRDFDYMGSGVLAPASKAQRGYLHSLCRQLSLDEDDLPYVIKELKHLTVGEASELIDMLNEQLEEQRLDERRDWHRRDVPFEF